MPGQPMTPAMSISLSKWPMLPTMALFFILAMCVAMMMSLLPVVVMKMSACSRQSSRGATWKPSMVACTRHEAVNGRTWLLPTECMGDAESPKLQASATMQEAILNGHSRQSLVTQCQCGAIRGAMCTSAVACAHLPQAQKKSAVPALAAPRFTAPANKAVKRP